MKSRKSSEGYFQVDHRFSPGNDVVKEGKQLETSTMRCGHCHRVVLLNPERVRTRFNCSKCSEYVCDFCGDPLQTGCLNLDQLFDKLQEQAFKDLNIKEI